MGESVALDLVVVTVPSSPLVDSVPRNRADPLPDLPARGEPPKGVQDAGLVAVFEERSIAQRLGKGSPCFARRRCDLRGVFPQAKLKL